MPTAVAATSTQPMARKRKIVCRSGVMGADAPRGLSDSSAARARSRNAVFSSPSRSRTGMPKETVQRIGTGISSPFGMARFRLAIQTGTISTPGRASATR